MAAQAWSSVTMNGNRPIFTGYTTPTTTRLRYRIVVAGGDRTVIRGVVTPEPTYGLVEPLLWGSGTISWPQFHAAFEKPGEGDWAWLKKYAAVRIQLVDDDDAVVATVFKGFIAGYTSQGRTFQTLLGGQASSRGSLMYRPAPIFPATRDIGHLAIGALRHDMTMLTMAPPPVTGIEVPDFGDVREVDFLTNLTARSTTSSGSQWTIMPDDDGVYQMYLKDTESIDSTVYVDGERITADLRRDFAEEADREFVTAVAANGMRIRFGKYPGLSGAGDPPAFPGHLEQGDSGADVYELSWRLWVLGYLPGGPNGTPETPDVYTADLTKAVKAMQRNFADDLDVNGEIGADDWAVAFNNDGQWSLRGSNVHPAAQKSFTRRFIRNASGQIIGRNPNSRYHATFADRAVDMGTVKDRGHARDYAQQDLSNDNAANLVGTIDLSMGAVIAGEHHPGDTLTADMLMDSRLVKPGTNALVHFQGSAVLMHVASASRQDSGTVQIAVDTRFRDALAVWEIHDRNVESRRDPARQWLHQNRSSKLGRDSMTGWDEIGGLVDSRVTCAGAAWTVFPVVAGQEGQIRDLTIQTVDDPAQFVLAIFGKRITAQRMAALIGDPFTDDGKRAWRRKNDTLTDDHWLLYEAGWDANPCGFHPSTKAEAPADFPDGHGIGDAISAWITGRWHDPAGFPYFCKDKPVLWVCLYPQTDTHLNPGRIMRVQLDDQV